VPARYASSEAGGRSASLSGSGGHPAARSGGDLDPRLPAWAAGFRQQPLSVDADRAAEFFHDAPAGTRATSRSNFPVDEFADHTSSDLVGCSVIGSHRLLAEFEKHLVGVGVAGIGAGT
jgi:hypothetical protein